MSDDIESLARRAGVEAAGFLFQHDETGRTTFADYAQWEGGPRWALVASLYSAPAVAAMMEQCRREVEEELSVLRQVIHDHNFSCEAACHAFQKAHAGYCAHYTNRDRTCPDCPQDWMIRRLAEKG